jgi:hypothetical protein
MEYAGFFIENFMRKLEAHNSQQRQPQISVQPSLSNTILFGLQKCLCQSDPITRANR